MKQNQLIKEQLSSNIQQVLNVFQEMNKVQSVSKVQLFDLIKLFKKSPHQFQQGWEVAYLKIFKIFHEKANRKMPPKFQKLATDFFAQILPANDTSALAFYDYFVQFLAEAVFSAIIGIRVTAARMLFHLLKNHAKVGSQTQEKVLKGVYFLIRLKISTYKQIGIKLASIILGWEGEIRNKIENELFRIMAIDQNDQIRKMTMTNIWITRQNLDQVLFRLRDKNIEIRNTILKKLVGEKYKLVQTTLSQRYKMLYDGYGSKESSIQQDTIKFFLMFFDRPDSVHSYAQFVQLFQPETLLAYPHLYSLFDMLTVALIDEIPISQLTQFVGKFCSHLRSVAKGGVMNVPIWELIWLKNIGKSYNSELRALFDENVPSGLELSRILSELVQKKDAFSMYECLQLIRHQKTADEMGKNKMFDSLKRMVVDLDYWSIPRENGGAKNDIYPPLTDADLKQKKMMLSYFDMPPISCSFDLLFEVGEAMKSLWPEHYQIELKQLMADWNNPEQNTLFKDKELAEVNIRKAEGQADIHLVRALRNKVDMIEEEIERQNAKTIIVIEAVMRMRPTASMDDYMSVIRGELGKKDQCQGLLLLGYYCLEEPERIENFLPLYWTHLTNQEVEKLPLLISLKTTIDFFVKYDFSQYTCEGKQSEEEFTFSNYLKKLKHFVISSDPDIRIISIEGLCRLIYHNKVSEENLGSCFIRILLLWWETSSQEASARSVHTISIFMKQFIEKGQRQVRKLSQWLCVFFKTLLIAQRSRRTINKKKIMYNLKVDEFIKRAVVVSMTILKYQKESRQIIWSYNQGGDQLGPQQLFMMFLFKHKELHFCLDKALFICDFSEDAPLETLILVKKQVEMFLQNSSQHNIKKAETVLKKLEADLQERIQIKNKETFNEELLNGLKQQLHQYEKIIEAASIALEEELRNELILIQNNDAGASEDQSEMQAEEAQIQSDLGQYDENFINSQQQSRMEKGPESGKVNRISESVEDQMQPEAEMEESAPKKNVKKRGNKRSANNGRRVKMAKESDAENSSMVEEARQHKIIAGRTRSRVNV